MSSTLVFHTGALGDTVLTWPWLRSLDEATFIAALDKARLTRRCIPHLQILDGQSPDMSRLFAPCAEQEISDDLRRIIGSARRIVSFVSSGDDAWAQNIKRMSAAEVRVAYVSTKPGRRSIDGDVRHVGVEQRMRIERQWGEAVGWEEGEARENVGGPVLVHPGSGGRAKVWPADRVDALLEHLRGVGREVRVVVGEVERERMEGRWLERWRRRHEVVEPVGLVELCEEIGRAGVFVGNDSGPTHLAGQMGVATVAMYGPTDARVWGPVGKRVVVLWPGELREMTWLEVETVMEAVARW
jgi:ADP-heptose:LPS heptosyltransferase